MKTPCKEIESPYLEGELAFVVPTNGLSSNLVHAISASPFGDCVDVRGAENGPPVHSGVEAPGVEIFTTSADQLQQQLYESQPWGGGYPEVYEAVAEVLEAPFSFPDAAVLLAEPEEHMQTAPRRSPLRVPEERTWFGEADVGEIDASWRYLEDASFEHDIPAAPQPEMEASQGWDEEWEGHSDILSDRADADDEELAKCEEAIVAGDTEDFESDPDLEYLGMLDGQRPTGVST